MGRYPYNKGKHLIVTVGVVYADESGIHGGEARYCVVAGYIGTPDQWDAFKQSWRRVLDEFRVDEFHAIDFFQTQRWQSSKSPYHDWTKSKGEAFLGKLLVRIDERDIWPLGGGVDLVDFNALSEEHRRLVTGAAVKYWNAPDGRMGARWATTGAPTLPYFAGFGLLIDEALSHTPADTKVHFVFDMQKHYEGRAYQTVREIIELDLLKDAGAEKLGGITYDRASQHEPLQAADLFVYIVNRVLTRGGRVSPEEQYAFDFLIRKRSTLRIQNAESFKKLVDIYDGNTLVAKLRVD